MKDNSLQGGSNQGPLACLAEMLTNTPSDLVERLRSDQQLYYIFEYCILFFQKPQRVWWRGPVGVVANIWANFFSDQFSFSAKFFLEQFFFRPDLLSVNFFSAIFFHLRISLF